MATVLNEVKSTYGSPYAFYTLSMDYSSRTETSIVISWLLTGHLQYSASSMGKGYILTATVYAGNNSQSKVLKASSEIWSGTGTHTISGSFTVSGLSASTSSIATALYVDSNVDQYESGYDSCQLNKTSGSALAIPKYNVVETLPVYASPLVDTSDNARVYLYLNSKW